MSTEESARRWFDALSPRERWELGDALVLGAFDWRDWFDDKPTGAFMRELERVRMTWEMSL